MYIDVQFEDGTHTAIPVSNSHTIRVISPDDKVQDSFAVQGVKSIDLDFEGAPDATQPTPVAVGAAEGPTPGNVVPDPMPDAHDAAVDQAAAVAADLAPVVAGDQPVTETAAGKLARAQADIDAALENWPDSPALQDAKAELAELSGSLSGLIVPPVPAAEPQS